MQKILKEFKALLEANAHAYTGADASLFKVISSDKTVLEHLCDILFGKFIQWRLFL